MSADSPYEDYSASKTEAHDGNSSPFEVSESSQVEKSYNNNKRGEKSSNEEREVCRNFLNGICFRGTNCKFDHPEERAVAKNSQEQIVVCRDYLNRGCRRDNCRLVHCTVADAEAYKRDGFISESLARAFIAVSGQRTIAGRPLCKEFIAGRCQRGYDCRFWHIDPEREHNARQSELRRSAGGALAPDAPDGDGRGTMMTGRIYEGRTPDNKRARYGEPSFGSYAPPPVAAPMFAPAYQMEDPEVVTLNEQNIALRRRIETLKQTMCDMQAANEALLSENRRLRANTGQVEMSGGGGGASAYNMTPRGALTAGDSVSAVSLASASGIMHPSIVAATGGAYPTSSDGMRWSFARM